MAHLCSENNYNYEDQLKNKSVLQKKDENGVFLFPRKRLWPYACNQENSYYINN